MYHLCPPSLRSAFRLVQSGLSSAFFRASHIVCPEQEQSHLEKCYNLADTLRCQILVIEAGHEDQDIELIADILDMAEGHIETYADLMELLAGGYDESQNGQGERASYRMGQALKQAHNFMKSYEKLSSPVRFLVNRALGLQKDIIVNLIEAKIEISARRHELQIRGVTPPTPDYKGYKKYDNEM